MSAPQSDAAPRVRDGARFAVTVLTAMNLVNYVDRYVPSAVNVLIQRDLGFDDEQAGLLLPAFVVVYMLASPVFGSLADRWPRKVVIALGVALWSLATGAAAFVTGFVSFVAARAFVGVGEAAYATLSPALLADFFAPERRNRVLTFFYVAIPVGSAVGFGAGALIGDWLGWRAAFLICGLPGVALALLALRIRDPGRGTYDADADVPPPPWRLALPALARNRVYVLAVAGYTAVTFASGVLGFWYPSFLGRSLGMGVGTAGLVAGGVAVVGGLAGTAFGGWLGERFVGRTRHPYMAMCGITMAVATVLVIPALTWRNAWGAVVCALVAQVFFWAYNGPLNTILVNCVPSAVRARAFAFSIFCIHALGDAVSPFAAGAVSKRTGSLPTAMLLVPLTTAVGAVVWLWAWRRAPAETAPAAGGLSSAA